MHTYIGSYICAHIHLYMSPCVYVYTLIHIYICTFIHTYGRCLEPYLFIVWGIHFSLPFPPKSTVMVLKNYISGNGGDIQSSFAINIYSAESTTAEC